MRKLKLREGTNTSVLFGHHDRHLKLIEEDLGVRLSARGEELTLDGNPEATRYAERVLTELAGLANDGMLIQPDDVAHALTALRQSPETPLKELLSNATTIVKILSASGFIRIRTTLGLWSNIFEDLASITASTE